MALRMRSFSSPDGLAQFVNGALETTNAVVSAGGSGYTALDELTVVGGTFYAPTRIRVDTVDGGGAVLTLTVLNGGEYSSMPSNPASVIGGTGAGATFTLTSGALLAQADVDEITPRAGLWHLHYWV